LASAFAEGGIEALTDLVGARIFGLIGSGVTEPAKRGLLRAFGRFLGRVGKLGAVEIPGEMATSAIQAYERQQVGIPTPDPWEAAKVAIGPSAVQTLLMGGIGAGAASLKSEPSKSAAAPTVALTEEGKEAEILSKRDDLSPLEVEEEIKQMQEKAVPVEKEVAPEEAAPERLAPEQRQARIEEELPEEEVTTDIPTEAKKVKKAEKKVTKAEPVADLETSYEAQKDIWFKRRDRRLLETKVEKRLLQRELREGLGLQKYTKRAQDVDKAIHIYLDTKRNPEHGEKYYKDLSEEQQRIFDLSQNLPEEAKAIADKIDQAYKDIGLEALEADVINNVLENYVGRVWNLEGKERQEMFRKFGIKSRHRKQRIFDTIIQGMATTDLELVVSGATSNLQILKDEIIKAIENKRFLKSLKKVKDVDGNPLITHQKLPGYVRIEHPNFTDWKWAGKVEKGKTYGKNFFVAEDGNVYEQRELYAPKDQAKNLNNILGISKLKGLPGVDVITKYNAITKAWILQTSLFHHLAFMRSYYFGTQKKKWAELNLRQAYKTGLESIEALEPEIVLGVENGLTLGLKQDWEEQLLHEKTIIGKMLDKTKATKTVKDAILKLRERQAEFLFGEFGAGLKAKAFIIELRNQTKEHPNEDPSVLAKRVARLINDDFGGLHLQRLGRNPTLQHIFRLMALAPDWTESNVRTMVKTITASEQAERQFYRKFWVGVIAKAGAATVLANFALAGGDLDELIKQYKIAWKAGNLKWLGIDITPIYRALGGEEDQRKYFNLFGHFKDPLKFMLHPIRSAHHKGSVVYGTIHEALAGIDWKGHRFTTFDELLETGKTVKWGPGQPIGWDQFPSYVLSQIAGTQPIQIQNFLAWITGEIAAFDAIFRSLGLNIMSVRTTDTKRRRPQSRRTRRER
jgi:hypothetical protein